MVLEIVHSNDANESQTLANFSEIEDGLIAQPNQRSRLLIELAARFPIDGRDVRREIEHIAAQLVQLHVNRESVRSDVDFRRKIEQETPFNQGILRKKKSLSICDCDGVTNLR